MLDPITALAIAATFLVAGTVKGVIGLGLPTVSLGLLTAALDLPTAMALLIVPSLATNLWQAASGGNGGAILRRIWPFLLTATITVWLGAAALTRLDLAFLSGLLGALLVGYATLSLAGVRLSISTRGEVWAGPLLGTANGILTGMTGSFVVPGVLFLQAIGMARDMLVQAMGMLFTASTIALALALQGSGLLPAPLALSSAAALLPAAVGMVLGQRLRRRLSEARFRQVFFFALLALGAYIVATAALGAGSATVALDAAIQPSFSVVGGYGHGRVGAGGTTGTNEPSGGSHGLAATGDRIAGRAGHGSGDWRWGAWRWGARRDGAAPGHRGRAGHPRPAPRLGGLGEHDHRRHVPRVDHRG